MRTTIIAAATAVLLSAVPALAEDFSFTGTLPNPGTVQFFDFNVGAASNVTLRTWSYAGGVNAAGQTIERGGFDPILAVFSLPSGNLIGQNDDGGASLVPFDAVSGRAWDTYFMAMLDPGAYRVSVMVYPNFAPTNVFTGSFAGASTFADVSGVANNPRTNAWAFDILNVDSAVQGVVPEPQSWALLIAGFGLTGAVMRRQRTSRKVAA